MKYFLMALIVLSVPAAWGGPVFNLYPNNLGPIAGNPLAGNGQTLGWGVQVVNDGAGWLLIGSVALAGDPAPFLVSGFTDLLSPWVNTNSYVFAPNETYKLDWAAGSAGLAEFLFPASGFGFSGPTVGVQITYEVFDANPFTDIFNTDVPGSTTVSVSLNESDPPSSASPEPATGFLVAAVLVWGGLRKRRLPAGRHRRHPAKESSTAAFGVIGTGGAEVLIELPGGDAELPRATRHIRMRPQSGHVSNSCGLPTAGG